DEIIHYNLGAALYKKRQYAKAIEEFTRALTTDDRNLEAKANYNLGNSKYSLARSKENTDLSQAVSLHREALEYYRRAIELDNKDKDAKYNYEFTQRHLKALLDKLKQQQQKQGKGEDSQQQQQQDKQGASGEGKDGQDSKGPGQEDDEALSSGKDKPGEQEDEREKQQGRQKEGQEQDPQGEDARDFSEREMSEEEARMLLEGYSEHLGSQNRRRQGVRSYPRVSKNW
ncbi:MAG: tetratricopeptide repeat protein, partial [Candidatus Omnitrophota bacterium]